MSRNKGAIIKVSIKTAHDTLYTFWGLNMYIGINVLVYERWLMVKMCSMTKFLCFNIFILFGQKSHFFPKNGGTTQKRLWS